MKIPRLIPPFPQWIATGLIAIAPLFPLGARAADRSVRAESMAMTRGETNRLRITFDTLGNEYAVGSTLCFDTNLLAFVGAVRGSSVSNTVPAPTFQVNTNRATNGQISFLIGLNIQTEQTWPPGTQSIVEVLFRALPGSTSTNTSVAFCSSITPPEVSSPQGELLDADFVNGTVAITGTCSSSLAVTNISISETGGNESVAIVAAPGCAWGTSNTNSWIQIVSGTSGSGNGSVELVADANSDFSSRTGVVWIAGTPVTVIQAGLTCTYVLFATEAAHDFGRETNAIDVLASDDCPWTITNTNSWIELLSTPSTVGSGVFAYAVAENMSPLLRTGVVTVANQTVTIVQLGAPCAYQVSPLSSAFPGIAATGQLSVATLAGCWWQASSSVPWITLAGGTFNGSGTVTFSIAANDNLNSRTGNVTIADQTVEVVQQGASCSFALTASNFTYSSEATTNSVAIITLNGCPWFVENTNAWIHVTAGASGVGGGIVDYEVEANVGPFARTGALVIAGQVHTVIQAGAGCAFAIAPGSAIHSAAAGSGNVSVTAPAGCSWSVATTNPWITVGSTTQTGVAYQVSANPDGMERIGSILVAGQTFVVTQQAAACAYSLGASEGNYSSAAQTGSVMVSTLNGCAWTVSTSEPWIIINSLANNMSSGLVTFTLQVNDTPQNRTGTISVADQTFTVRQSGQNCSPALLVSQWTHRAGSETGLVGVAVAAGCTWAVANTNDWISINSGAGTGNGTVAYSLLPNPNAEPRTGIVSIGGTAFTITQVGSGCGYRVSPTNRVHGTAANSNSVSFTASGTCPWSVINTNPWITILSNATGSGNATIGYGFTRNTDGALRSGVINIAGEILTVTQWGTNCGFSLAPVGRVHGSGAENGSIALSASSASCSWTVVNTNSWITINTPGGTGGGTIAYSVSANANGQSRSGTFTVGTATFSILQAGLPCSFSLSTFGASFDPAGGTDAVAVTTGDGCSWNVINTNTWVTIHSPLTNISSGSVTFAASANPFGVARSGRLLIAGQTFTVVQSAAPCSFALSTTSAAFGWQATQGSVSVTSLPGCAWTVSNTNSWIEFTNLAYDGSAVANFTLQSNPSSLPRIGMVTVAGQSFSVTQGGAPCTYALGTNIAAFGFRPTNGAVAIATAEGCVWAATATNAWITIPTASGTNTAIVPFQISTNPTVFARTGFVSVATETLVVIQGGSPCSFALSETNAAFGIDAAIGSVFVTASAGCTWTVVNTNSWITIDSVVAGTVRYSVDSNSGAVRVGNIVIGGIPHRVSQAGSLRILRASDVTVRRGETNKLVISIESTGVENALGFSLCFDTNELRFVRSVAGSSVSNLNVAFDANVSGGSTGQLGFTLALAPNEVLPAGSNALVEVLFAGRPGDLPANTAVGFCDTPLEREITDERANLLGATYINANVTVLSACTFSLSSSELSFSANGGADSLFVITHPSCSWSAANSNDWLRFTSETNLVGTAAVSLEVDSNPTGAPRVGTISVGGQNVAITQAGQPCSYTLTPALRAIGYAGDTGTVRVAALAGCSWLVNNTNSWIQFSSLSGSGSADIFYTVASNTVATTRTGMVQIASLTFRVIQGAVPCSYSLVGTTNKLHGYAAETGSVSVASVAGCAWTIQNTNAWIVFAGGTNGTGSAEVDYLVAANADGAARTGTVMIATRPFTIRQPANPCPVTLAPWSSAHASDWSTNSISVVPTGGCAWTVINTNEWMVFPTTNGVGNAAVTYIVQPNPFATIRTGSVFISGREYVVSQAAATCLFILNPASATHDADAAGGTIAVNTTSTCSWVVENTNAWLQLTAQSGTGPGAISYSVDPNPSNMPRTGNVVIGNRVLSVTQNGAPCIGTLSAPDTNLSFTAGTGSVSLAIATGCRWTAATSNSWITLATTNYTNSATVTFAVAANSTALARTGQVTIADQTFSVTQAGVPCVTTISPTNRVHGFGAATNIVSVYAPVGCAWPPTSSSLNWITFQGSPAGSGDGSITYIVGANPSSLSRTGTVSIAGQAFSITQSGAPCVFALGMTNMTHGFAEDVGEVAFDGPLGCPWTVVNTNTWLQIISATSGTGGSTLTYLVASNALSLSRTGFVQIAGQSLRVVQAGAPCTFNISAASLSFSSAPDTNNVTVLTAGGCIWGATTTNNWIQIIAGFTNSGNAVVRIAVGTNASAAARSGAVLIAGQPLQITQQGAACSYRITPTSDTLGAGNVTGLVSVASAGGCTWSVIETNDWVSLKSGTDGTNNGLVRYTLTANPNPSPRTAMIVIAGQVFTLTQLGSPCTYTLSSTGRLHGSLSETGLVSVTAVAECTWTIDNTNSWLQFSSTSGAGSAVITYTVQQNPTSVDRSGTFIIGNQPYTVTQLGAECSYTLASNSASHGGLAETGVVSVITPIGCAWQATETNSWLSLLPPTSQTNSGVLSYAITANVSGAPRLGTIRIGAQAFTITQTAVYCSFTVGPTSASHGFEAETNFISVTTSNVCPWTVSKSNSWINIISSTNQTGTATIGYYVSANPSSTARTGVVMVAGQPITVRQAGLVCSYTIAPIFRAHGFRAETNQISMTCPSLCTWAVANTNSWLTILTALNNVGSGTIRYAVSPNATSSPRTGTISIDGQLFTITQNGTPFVLASNKTVQCNTAWDFDPPTPSGNCTVAGASVYVVSTTTNLGCGSTYTARRIWDATDACGVNILATQLVTVVSPPPIMTCAPDKNVECGAAWTFNAPTAIDACSGASLLANIRVVSTTTNNAGMCAGTFAVTRTWEVADACSNKTTCSQTVRIVDTTPPVATCPLPKTVECGSAWTFDPPTGADSCSPSVTVRIQSTVTNTTAGCGYIARRIWDILDACTNVTTCTQTVTAVDTTPPALTCAPPKTVECGSAWNFDLPTAVDNCSGTNVSWIVLGTATNTVTSCGSAFVATRTWQVTDGCGNPNFCSQTVTVLDTTPPVASTLADKTVELGEPWNFDAPTAVDACSGTNVSIRIIGTTTNRVGFCGSTFTATRVWDIADGCSNKVSRIQIVTVRDTTPPQITCAANKTVNCQAPWAFDPPTAVDMPVGNPATIVVVSTVTNGTCGNGFSVTRTWRATDECSNSVVCSQTVTGQPLVNVAGTIFVPTSYPLSPSDKRLSGATVLAPTNATTDFSGAFVCTFDAATNDVALTPIAPAASAAADGVTTIDISLIRRHILAVAELDSPYKLLAADVDGSGTISTLDLTAMRRVILGVTNRFSRGLWRFVPSNHSFKNPQAPWDAPTNRIYREVLNDLSAQDFVAIKLGDVNASWTTAGDGDGGGGSPSSAAEGPKPVVRFEVSNTISLPATSAVVTVKASGFRRITSVQGTLRFDPTLLRYVGAEQFGVSTLSSSHFGTNFASVGQVTFSWDDPTATAATLPDGAAIFSLRFDVLGALGRSCKVAIDDSVTMREAGVDFTAADFQTVDGALIVLSLPETQLKVVSDSGSGRMFSIHTVAGRSYTLEYTETLPAMNWTALPPVPGDGTEKTFTDQNPSGTHRFYRIRIE